MVKTFNEDLRDFLLQKSHYMQRLENGTVRDMIEPFKKAKQKLLEQLASLQNSIDETTFVQVQIQRANMQIAEIDNVLKLAAIESSAKLDEIREEVAIIERDSLSSKFIKSLGKIGVDFNALPYAQINFILNNPMLGESIGDKLLWVEAEAVRKIKQEILQSIILGEGIPQVTKRLLGVGEILGGDIGKLILNRAEMIARTEILYVSNSINKAIFDENRDVIKGLEYVATLDKRTCQVCGPLDGTIYKYNKDGSLPIDYKPLPRHVRCRCLYAPVTYSWQELAINQGIEIKNQTGKDYFSGYTERPYTYNDWLKDQSESFQKDILGKIRYEAWIAEEFTPKEMPAQKQSYTSELYKNKIDQLILGE